MANNWERTLPATFFIGDGDAQLVAGDVAARRVNHVGRPGWAFDDTAEEAILSAEFDVPSTHTGSGTFKAILKLAAASDATNDSRFDVFVEKKTPGSTTLDMEAASGWGSANSATKSFAGTTAGDLVELAVTLSDSVAAGDLLRIGVRCDCDHADQDVVGDVFLYAVVVREEA